MTFQTLKDRLAPGARAFLRDQRGSAAVLFAGGVMMLVGMAAISVDLSYLFVLRGKLQTTADAAALAAVGEVDDETARATALNYAALNMPSGNHGAVLATNDVRTGIWDFRAKTFTPGAAPANALRVITRRAEGNGNAVGLFFAQALGFTAADVETQAIAAEIVVGAPCLMSLDPAASAATKVNNGTVIADGCAFHTNSNAPDALDIASGGVMEADSVCVRGGVAGNGNSTPGPQTNCPPLADPLADMAPPSYGGCDFNNVKYSNGTHTLTPGVYCGGIGLSGSAQVDFLPGEYIIKGGTMKTTGNSASMQGDEVMFYFTDDAVLNLAGQGTLDLSAPTSGDYKGMLFYGDPDSDPDIKHGFSGNGNMTYDGVMYFPGHELTATGNGTGSTSAGNTVAIARLLKFGGNGSLTFKYDPAAPVPLPDDLANFSPYTKPSLVN
jgi:hypothetical protein